MKKTITEKSYNDKMHTYGRVWTLMALAVIMSVPVIFSAYLDQWPTLQDVLKGLAKVAVLFYATAVIEIVAYTPILGTGSMYLSFVTGNISNLKLPCALSAMEAAKVKSNSDEGEVISTIAIATSSIVTTVIIALCVVVFRPILPYITDESSVFAPAFKQVLPALFGALGATYFAKHWKISILPVLLLCVVLLIKGTVPAGTLIPIGVVVSLAGTFAMYKLKWL